MFGGRLEKILKASGLGVRFKLVADTEKSKSIETAVSVIRDLAHYDRRKQVFILAFGGGVVGDLAGFIASIYKRGIPYIQVPTTLLAQVDSAIGGKTGVDLAEGKNLIGAIYQPRLVLSDVRFLKTLSRRQMRTGLAEVIKYAIIKDKELFSYLEARYNDVFRGSPDELQHIIKRCSKIKADIVSCDEREEKKIRTILNFGHTVGHAIEAASSYKGHNHGEAIALGILVASDISQKVKLLSAKTAQRIENLIRLAGLPRKIKKASLDAVINAHYRDKKFIGAKNRFVLIEALGKTKIIENIPLGIIREAIRKRLNPA
jgi:3-dehydroquinate synthase